MLEADDDSRLLGTSSGGPGADGCGIQIDGLGSVLDGGTDEIIVGVLSSGADIQDKGCGMLHHTLSMCHCCTGLGSNSSALAAAVPSDRTS
jgi:hypothetical protein